MSDLISSDLGLDMKNSWGSDPDVFRAMDYEFDFLLDVAASEENKLCYFYLTKDQDATKADWYQHINKRYFEDFSESIKSFSVWCNPPYGRGWIKKFMQKAIEQKAKGVTTVMLVPATLEARWLPIQDISEIRIITGGRLTFLTPCDYTVKGENGKPDRLVKKGDGVAGNTKGSMFVIFRPTKMPLSIRLIDRDELLGK